jgi:hypothetical protein
MSNDAPQLVESLGAIAALGSGERQSLEKAGAIR